MIIDAHQHVWDLARARYSWLDEALAPINRTTDINEVLPQMRRIGVEATVLVQAADNSDDTANMLRVAHEHAEVVGVVAWVPLDKPDTSAAMLDELRQDSHVVGVRALLHAKPDPEWVLRDGVDASLGFLESAGLAFDYVTNDSSALALVPQLSQRHPDLKVVIDHLGKPPVSAGEPERLRWRNLLAAAVENPRVTAKLSGLYGTTGSAASWTIDSVRPFVADAFDLLGADRLMFGSDWPISELEGGYARVWDALSELANGYGPEARAAVFGGTAETAYGLDPALLEAAAAVGKEDN